MAIGIDYGMGTTNIDHETGIRYGVIPSQDVGEPWYEEAEANYGTPACPLCGDSIAEGYCEHCDEQFEDHECYPETPYSWYIDNDEYTAEQSGDDCDIFITKSPYYTRAGFCSPCAPGACHLRSPHPQGEKTYCFGPDWFEGNKAPYPIYRVSDNREVI